MKADARRIMRSAAEEIEHRSAQMAMQEHGWNSDKVLNAVVDAYRTLRKMPDKTRHKTIRSAWPDDIYATHPDAVAEMKEQAEWESFWLADDELETRRREKNKTYIPPSAVEINRMSIALVWPARYIEDRAIRVVLMECSVIRAADLSLRKMCRERGWPYTTTFMRCQRAGAVIAGRLNEEGIAAW